MGVDSRLPDFRGENGFWRTYPALKAEGIGFQDIANGEAFRTHPLRTWGFYGHRLNLYRHTAPELIRLNFVDRLADEARACLEAFWQFMLSDNIGREIERHLMDVTATFASPATS